MSARWLAVLALAVVAVSGSVWFVRMGPGSSSERASVTIVILPEASVDVSKTADAITSAIVSMDPDVEEVVLVNASGAGSPQMVGKDSKWGANVVEGTKNALLTMIRSEANTGLDGAQVGQRIASALEIASTGDSSIKKYVAIAGAFPACYNNADANSLNEKLSFIGIKKNVHVIWAVTDTRAYEQQVFNQLKRETSVTDSRVAVASARPCTRIPTFIAVASKLNSTEANACAEAIADRIGIANSFVVAYNAAVMPAVVGDNRGQLIRDLSDALEQGSPKTLNESSTTLKTAIVSATATTDTMKRSLVVVGQLPIDVSSLGKDQKAVLLDPTDVARLSERPDLLSIVFVVLPGTASSNDAIIRLRGLLNRRGVMYDSVLVRNGSMR